MAAQSRRDDNAQAPSGQHSHKLPRVRKFFSWAFKGAGTAVLLFILTILMRETTLYMSSGVYFSIAMTIACFMVATTHKKLDDSKIRMYFWRILGALGVYATVLLFGYQSLPLFLGWFVLLPLTAVVPIILIVGVIYMIRKRKDAEAFTGELYLVAGSLALTVGCKVGIWFGQSSFQSLGHYGLPAAYTLLFMSFALLFAATALHPGQSRTDQSDETQTDGNIQHDDPDLEALSRSNQPTSHLQVISPRHVPSVTFTDTSGISHQPTPPPRPVTER